MNFDDLIPQKPLPSRGRTMLEGGLQGATLNTADEIYNRLGALGAYGYQALTDMPTESQDSRVGGVGLGALGRGINSLQELTDVASESTNSRLADQLQQRPALSIGSNIAGALLTGGAGAGTKGGVALSNSLRSGSVLGKELGLAGRVAKGAAAGATAGGVAGFGSGSGAENRLESAVGGAKTGAALGAAIPVAGALVNKVIPNKQAPVPTAEDLRLKANELYKVADETGGTLKGWFSNQFLDKIKDVQPASVAGRKVPTDPKLTEALDYVAGLKNQRLTLQDAQALDEYLSDAIDGFTELGRVNKSGQKLLEVQRTFRDMIEGADESLIEGGKDGFEALKAGRAAWSKMSKLRDIEKIVQRAELMDNPATGIKTGFRTLLTNAKKTRGYSKEELKLIEKAASTGVVSDLLRTGGSRLIPIIAGAGGGGIAGTAAAGAGAMASRGLATKNALYNANKVARAVAGQPASTSRALALPAPVRTAPVIGAASAGPTEITVRPKQELPEVNLPQIDFNDLIPQAIQGGVQPQASAGGLMENIKQAESAGDPNAQNPNSSASGLYQFTDGTWKSAVDKWGRSQGIKYSDKANPQAQEFLANKLTEDNARILQNKGIEPSNGNLYFAHFMGAPAASKAISMLGKNAIAARSFPSAASANRSVFYDGSRPRTIDEVYELITSKVV